MNMFFFLTRVQKGLYKLKLNRYFLNIMNVLLNVINITILKHHVLHKISIYTICR